MDKTDYRSKLQDLFQRLGISRKYAGYNIGITAAEAVIQNNEYLRYVTKELYPMCAEKENCTVCSVERNIRTISKIAYQRNPELLAIIARFKPQAPLPAADFIDVVAQYVQHTTISKK